MGKNERLFVVYFAVFVLQLTAIALPQWGDAEGLLLGNTEVTFGLFQVCGYNSYKYAFPSISQDCYFYNSESPPTPLWRVNHLSDLVGCGQCDHYRRAAAAFAVIALLLLAICVIRIWLSAYSDVRLAALAASMCGVISFSVWVAFVNQKYNKNNAWLERASRYGEPSIRHSTCLILSGIVWVVTLFLSFFHFSRDDFKLFSVSRRTQRASLRAPARDEISRRRSLSQNSFTTEPEEATSNENTGNGDPSRDNNDGNDGNGDDGDIPEEVRNANRVNNPTYAPSMSPPPYSVVQAQREQSPPKYPSSSDV